jgi:hypothetical protein
VSTSRAALVIIGAGLLTFGAVFTLLEFSPSAAAPSQLPPMPAPTNTALATDSFAAKLHPGELAVGVPIAGAEALLRDMQPGDRLDIIASLTAASDAQSVTAVVVRGATVLRSPTATDPLLVEVSGADAMALAHLVLGGTRLSYIIWPSNGGGSVSEPRLLDERTARSLLGLAASPTAGPTEAAAVATLTPPAAQPAHGSGFLYQVQAGDTWEAIAATFGLPVALVRAWNEIAADEDPIPGRLVFIPRPS